MISKVTFLYKLDKGVCPKSYGFNVANMADMPKEIIKAAHKVSKQLEEIAKSRKFVKNLVRWADPSEIRKSLMNFKI